MATMAAIYRQLFRWFSNS